MNSYPVALSTSAYERLVSLLSNEAMDAIQLSHELDPLLDDTKKNIGRG